MHEIYSRMGWLKTKFNSFSFKVFYTFQRFDPIWGFFPIKVHGAGFQELGIFKLLQNLFYDLYFADLNSEIQCRMSKNDAGEWQCNECYKTSNVKTNILEHIEAFHIQSSGYECEICCKVFKTRHSLRTHRNVKHKEVKYTNYK